MARFPSGFKRGVLKALWLKAPEGANTLQEAITNLLTAQFESVTGGYNITSVSGAGHSTSFFVPSNGVGLTPATLIELASELDDIFTESATALATGDEALIYAEMLNRLQPIRRLRDDFTLVRSH